MKKIVNIICELFKKVKSNLEEWKKSENGYDILQVEEETMKIFLESSGEIMGEVLKELCQDKEIDYFQNITSFTPLKPQNVIRSWGAAHLLFEH